MTALLKMQQSSSNVLANSTSTATNTGVSAGSSSSRPRRRGRRRGVTSRGGSGPSNHRNSIQIPTITASSLSLLIAVFLWYTLGILSISTTKILLEHLPPMVLTLLQLFLGSSLLRLWSRWHNNDWEFGALALTHTSKETLSSSHTHPHPYSYTYLPVQMWKTAPYLFLAASCFTFGFLATNFGFGASSASFVETIKAAEPLTSAGLAVGFGLEDLSDNEWVSLGCIVLGVVFSTLGNSRSATTTVTTSLWQSILSCTIVMFSNLCFSLRGLYQKWFQSKRKLSAGALQCVMQHLGVWLLAGPVLIFHGSWLITSIKFLTLRGILLALINGLAFTSYKSVKMTQESFRSRLPNGC